MSSSSSGSRADITLGGDVEQQSLSVDNLPTSVLQALYREVTGKTETMTRTYKGNHIITLEDISQLCSRIDQTLQQYDVAEKTTSINVSHHKDDKLNFSSIERFKFYEIAKAKPVSSLIMSFNFLIKVPETGKHFNYKLVVDITPFVLEEHEDLMAQYSLPFSRLNGPPITSNVEYVDYVVARSLLSACDDWVEGLKSIKQPKISKWIKSKHDIINIMAPLTAILVAIFTASRFIPNDKTGGVLPIHSLGVWMCGSVAWIFILYVIFELLNKVLYHRVLDLRSATFVLINRGDEINKNAVEKRIGANKWVLTAIGLAALLNIVCSLVADRLIDYLGWS